IGYMEVDGKRNNEPAQKLPEAEPQRDTEDEQESKTGESEKSKDATARDRAEGKEMVGLVPAVPGGPGERGVKPEAGAASGPGGGMRAGTEREEKKQAPVTQRLRNKLEQLLPLEMTKAFR